MGEKFGKGSLIVLVLLVIVAAVMAVHAVQSEERLLDVIEITDGRTEQLLNKVNELTDRIARLERR